MANKLIKSQAQDDLFPLLSFACQKSSMCSAITSCILFKLEAVCCSTRSRLCYLDFYTKHQYFVA